MPLKKKIFNTRTSDELDDSKTNVFLYGHLFKKAISTMQELQEEMNIFKKDQKLMEAKT